ncbi:hypothetical protein BJX99DRAFT_219636 [Aspergillus californicus]
MPQYPNGRYVYEFLQFNQALVEVEMGEIGFTSFDQNMAIGTKGLGSCSVVIIASQHGAIVAHIKLIREDDPSLYSGDNNARRAMDQVRMMHDYYVNLGYFPSALTTVVCATFMDNWVLSSQVNIMQSVLQQMGYSPDIRTYPIPAVEGPGQGEVVVSSTGNGMMPMVYVKDSVI